MAQDNSAIPLYGGSQSRITTSALKNAKTHHEIWPMLTCYDSLTASLFDELGVPVLLVGDSAAMVFLGYDSTLPITLDELIPLVRAVSRSTTRALVVADLPFGSYQAAVADAVRASIRLVKEGGAQAVKIEGGTRVTETVKHLVEAGIPVMGHLGLTPQSVNVFGGYKVQGRGDAAAELVREAKELELAGCFSIVLEAMPADTAKAITEAVSIPTIGIGAGIDVDAQVLVWQDLAGLTKSPLPRFVKRYADMRTTLTQAVNQFAQEVKNKDFPSTEHTYQ
jgi:3-methyl-2-oxobutanoate hydroxymethyltransferase